MNMNNYAWDAVNAITLQEDGRIIAVGYGTNDLTTAPTATYASIIARFQPDGRSLDTAFGSNGIIINGSYDSSQAKIVNILSDGRILVAGSFRNAGGPDSFYVARYDQNGALDISFGTSGTTTGSPGTDPAPADLSVLPDGKILFAGTATNASNGTNDIFLTRYNADGSPDSTFGNSGRVFTDFNAGEERAVKLGIQADGKILVAAQYQATVPILRDDDFAVFRYTADGVLDTTFGRGFGMVTTNSGVNLDDFAQSMVVQQDGKIIVTGYFSSGSNLDIGLCRYWP